jgi:hypothetical protein
VQPLHIYLQRRILVNEDGCWIWQLAPNDNGYGKAKHRTVRYLAHRLVYTYIKGEIPEGMQLDHLCRVRICVNPDHLEPVTGGENIRRRPEFAAGPGYGIFWEAGRNRWCASIKLEGGKAKRFRSYDRATAERRAADWLAANPKTY